MSKPESLITDSKLMSLLFEKTSEKSNWNVIPKLSAAVSAVCAIDHRCKNRVGDSILASQTGGAPSEIAEGRGVGEPDVSHTVSPGEVLLGSLWRLWVMWRSEEMGKRWTCLCFGAPPMGSLTTFGHLVDCSSPESGSVWGWELIHLSLHVPLAECVCVLVCVVWRGWGTSRALVQGGFWLPAGRNH